MLGQTKYIHFIEIYRKAYPDLQKKEGVQKWAGIVIKSAERSGATPKVYH